MRCSSSLQSFLGHGVNHIAKCLLAGYARSCIWSWVWTYICLALRGLNISLKLVEPLCFLVFELSLHVLASCVCMLGSVIFLLIYRHTLCTKSVNPFGCLVNKCFPLVCCLTFDCVHGAFVRQKLWVWIASNELIFSF